MLSNHESSKKNELKQNIKVWVQPLDNITFVCSKNQIVGIIKIFLEGTSRKNFEFHIKTTHKNHYKVSQSSGFITKSPLTIYIYLKEITTLDKTLKNKFKVSVIDNKKMKKIFSHQYGVIIESNLHSPKEDSSHLEMNNASVSRLASNYTSPSVLQDTKKEFSTLRMTNVEEQRLTKKQKQVLKPHLNIKQRLNESIQVLEKRKHKEIKLQRQIKKKKAKQRFSIYITFFIFIIAFMSGVYFSKLTNKPFLKSLGKKVKAKIDYS